MDRDFPVRHNGLLPLTGSAFALSGLAICIAAWSGHASAMGVTRLLTHSSLGQPLNLLFPVRLAADETLSRDCVHADVLAGESRVPPPMLQFDLEGDNENSVRAVRLRSTVRIDEPIVTVTLNLGCPVRFSRQFTAFIDPPDARPSVTVAAVPPPLETVVADVVPASPAPVPTAAQPAVVNPKPVAPPPQVPSAPAQGMVVLAVAPAASHPAGRKPAPASPQAGSAVVTASASPSQKESAKPRTKTKVKPHAEPADSVVAQAEGGRAGKVTPQPASRLRLDPPELLPTGLAAAEPASAPVPVPDLTQSRLKAVEDRLSAVQQEGRAAEERIASLKAQLEAAQNQRYQNAVMLGQLLAMFALAAACFYLWRSRQRERSLRDAAWRASLEQERREESRWGPVGARAALAPVAAADARPSPKPAPAPAYPFVPASDPSSSPAPIPYVPLNKPAPARLPVVEPQADFEEQTMASAFVESDAHRLRPPGLSLVEPDLVAEAEARPTAPLPLMQEALSMPFAELKRTSSPPPMPMPMPMPSQVILDDENHQVSVEELIDLEQQVDFFQVLGQDDAAVELLQERIRTGRASALPYLKLLEIFQRRGEELEFIELTVQFGQRFKAVPPTWGSDLNEGRGLEAYGHALQEIQKHWNDAAASMSLLQNMLSHGGADNKGFDLPAYRDLLMLYSVARDQSERDVRGDAVDLFLPLDTDEHGSDHSSMMATMMWQSSPTLVTGIVELDLDLS